MPCASFFSERKCAPNLADDYANLDRGELTLKKLAHRVIYYPFRNRRVCLGRCFSGVRGYKALSQDGERALPLCQQALALLSSQDFVSRALVSYIQLMVSYTSPINDAVAAIESGQRACSLACRPELTPFLAISLMGTVSGCLIGVGKLHKAMDSHPHIVRVMDFGLDGENPFLVIDYVPNGTMRQQHPEREQLPLALVISYVSQAFC